jgi:hypothetical protein
MIRYTLIMDSLSLLIMVPEFQSLINWHTSPSLALHQTSDMIHKYMREAQSQRLEVKNPLQIDNEEEELIPDESLALYNLSSLPPVKWSCDEDLR